jgi:hypothetical protein
LARHALKALRCGSLCRDQAYHKGCEGISNAPAAAR